MIACAGRSPGPRSGIMTGVGVISLAGIVVNNAIVPGDFIQQLRARASRRPARSRRRQDPKEGPAPAGLAS